MDFPSNTVSYFKAERIGVHSKITLTQQPKLCSFIVVKNNNEKDIAAIDESNVLQNSQLLVLQGFVIHA